MDRRSLIHLLRNSCDHGIRQEQRKGWVSRNPEDRAKAYQDGNNVVIEVGDDGQGINVKRSGKR